MSMDDKHRFQFPIDGYILMGGYGQLISVFSDFGHAMEVQKLLAREHKGNQYTLIWCDGYCTEVHDAEKEEVI